MSRPEAALADAASHRRMAGLMLLPGAPVERLGVTYEPVPGTWFAIVDDSAASGPGAFDAAQLRDVSEDAVLVVASGDFTPDSAAIAAAMIAFAPAGRVVVIATAAGRHASWTQALRELTGRPPALHVADPSLSAAEISPTCQQVVAATPQGPLH